MTEEAAQGRGLARGLVAQAARRVIERGAVPTYLHADANVRSAKVAVAAGFPDVGWRILGASGARARAEHVGELTSGTRSRRYCRWVLATASCLGPQPVDLGPQHRHLALELEHPLHALEVEPGGGEVLDALQLLDVDVAVAAAAADGARRVEQALALVDAQRLRMDPGQLGRDRDHVHGPLLASSLLVLAHVTLR